MMQWSTSKFINESLTRQDFIPPHPNPLPHAARGGEGMDRFGLQAQIYDLFFENASENDKFNLKQTMFI